MLSTRRLIARQVRLGYHLVLLLLVVLLLDVGFGSTLLSLSTIMQVLVASLLLAVARDAVHSTTNGALGTVRDTTPEVTKLTLSLLSLALSVLVNALLLQALRANEPAERFLGRAHGLVPGAFRTLGVILGNGARARGRVRANFGGGVRGVVL